MSFDLIVMHWHSGSGWSLILVFSLSSGWSLILVLSLGSGWPLLLVLSRHSGWHPLQFLCCSRPLHCCYILLHGLQPGCPEGLGPLAVHLRLLALPSGHLPAALWLCMPAILCSIFVFVFLWVFGVRASHEVSPCVFSVRICVFPRNLFSPHQGSFYEP